jgi:hypothetical protein
LLQAIVFIWDQRVLRNIIILPMSIFFELQKNMEISSSVQYIHQTSSETYYIYHELWILTWTLNAITRPTTTGKKVHKYWNKFDHLYLTTESELRNDNNFYLKLKHNKNSHKNKVKILNGKLWCHIPIPKRRGCFKLINILWTLLGIWDLAL